MLSLAEQCQESPAHVMSLVRQTLARLADAWREKALELPMLEAHRLALFQHWQRVPLLRQHGFDKLGQPLPSRRPRRPRRSS